MALKVWLPLDGDLRNLGCSDLQFTNENTSILIIDDAGKIGSCYKRASAKTAGRIISDKTLNLNGDLSICCWAKVTATVGDTANGLVSMHSHANNTGFGITVKQISSTDYRISCSTGNGSNRTYCSYYGTTNIKDAWHHLTLTYNNTLKQFKLWVDGKLELTQSYANASRDEYIVLFEWSTTYNEINYRPACSLNDVRIYDHCLSPAEVHEIAMGLVLHYKLDKNKSQLANVYNYPTFDTSNSGGGWNHWGQSGASGAYGQNTDKKYIWNKNNTYSHWVANASNATGNYLLYQEPAFDGGYRSTQCIIKEENGLPITTSIVYASWNARSGGLTNDTFSSIVHLGDGFYLCKAEGIKQDGSNDLVGFYVKPGYKVYFSEAYLENSKEMCSDIFEQDNLTTIEDSSGYGHDGTIIGDLISSNDTKRYSTSTRWNCSSPTDNSETGICYIQTPFSLTTPLQLTVAWWAKPENGYGGNTNHAAFCTSNNSSRPTDYNSTALHHRDAGFDIYPSDGSGAKRLSFTYIRNEWHHYAITYDGTTAKSYKDGVLQTSISVGANKTLATFSQLYIGYSQAGGARRKTLGNYSDFRIYCTPLLDNDIKMLYNVGMRVDNLQNLHTFEYKENTSNLFRSELIMPFAKAGYTEGNANITTRNGSPAMDIRAHIFYQNLENSQSGFLKDYFRTNTSYIFDMWIDTDAVIYNGNNVAGGLRLWYTDNSYEETFVFTGGNKGWQHKVYITPSNKTLDRIEVYYYIGQPVYCRLDSCICPLSNLKLHKTGIFEGTNLLEETNTKLIKNALIETNELIEL